MTKRYGILRKKLDKLESNLHLLFTFSPATTTHDILSHGIEQQLEFLNHLLAAEIASCPSKPRHLHHIARRLNELETAFLHSQQQLDGNFNDHDAASVCSCSESCLNDDGEAAVEHFFGDSIVNNYDVPEEDSPVVDIKGGVEDIEEVDGEEKGSNNGRYFGILGCGMMMGAVCMGFVMVKFYDCFLVIQPSAFLIPT
ncbi:hypothetical protein BC332_07937 [Capsicum chinense]|nr:hypothetical protein BC332_07937 [Capsicum chinense]